MDNKEVDLIINAIQKQADDIKYIRDKVDGQADKINDLCSRQTMTEDEVKREIQGKVKHETKTLKILTVIGNGVMGVVLAITSLKQSGYIH